MFRRLLMERVSKNYARTFEAHSGSISIKQKPVAAREKQSTRMPVTFGGDFSCLVLNAHLFSL